MPIEFTCPHCQSLLRVDDANAGKRACCPNCNLINRIPGERVEQAPPVSQQFFIDSVSGQTYGPVTKNELDDWVTQGRISSSCVVRATGEKNGQPATVYFPQLVVPGSGVPESHETTKVSLPNVEAQDDLVPAFPTEPKPTFGSTANPYASPASNKRYDSDEQLNGGSLAEYGVTPTEVDVGKVFTIAYEVFWTNFGLMFGIGIACGFAQMIANLVIRQMDDADGVGLALGFFSILVLYLIQIYLAIGQTRICLKLLRGEQADFMELLNGGDKFISMVGYNLLIFIPLAVGFLLFVVPGVMLMLYFWVSYILIVDNKTSVIDSFGVAAKIGSVNLLSSFVLIASSFGILILGSMFCFFGMFMADSFVAMLMATAYLMMTGQLRLNR